jgi:hypothetical protein
MVHPYSMSGQKRRTPGNAYLLQVGEMGWLALLCAVAAVALAWLPGPGLFLAIGLGIAAITAGIVAYRRVGDPSSGRLAGAAAVTIGLMAALLGGARYAATLAAISYLERLVG